VGLSAVVRSASGAEGGVTGAAATGTACGFGGSTNPPRLPQPASKTKASVTGARNDHIIRHSKMWMVAHMEEHDFNAHAEAILSRIEAALECSVADLDFERVGDQVLQIDFADGSRIVVNRHDPAREIWVAARSGGFHYRWQEGCWRDTRNGSELLSTLSDLVSTQAGEPVSLL
jgi:CyaY protein